QTAQMAYSNTQYKRIQQPPQKSTIANDFSKHWKVPGYQSFALEDNKGAGIIIILKTEITQHIGIQQPQTIFKLDISKNLEKNNKDFLTITLGDFNGLANPKKNIYGKIIMELQHELTTSGYHQIQTGDEQIIPHNTSLKINAFNTKVTKARQGNRMARRFTQHHPYVSRKTLEHHSTNPKKISSKKITSNHTIPTEILA
ncbi:2072_t:CDS:2, partial [Acaulospora morrowiae]